MLASPRLLILKIFGRESARCIVLRVAYARAAWNWHALEDIANTTVGPGEEAPRKR
jgi:hypothetical protein